MLSKHIFFPLALVVSHSTFIVGSKYRREGNLKDLKFSKPKDNSQFSSMSRDFRIGATDDVLMDSLQSGDVLLFRRKWYLQFLPMSLALIGYRRLTGSEFDHIGIVFVDKMGKVFVVENTPFRGIVCRPFEDRIRMSQAELIECQLLAPRDLSQRLSKISKSSNENPDFALAPLSIKDKVSTEWSFSSEFTLFVRFIFLSLLGKEAICPNFLLVKNCLNFISPTLHIENNESDEKLTIRSFDNKEILLKCDEGLKVGFAPENILIRTR